MNKLDYLYLDWDSDAPINLNYSTKDTADMLLKNQEIKSRLDDRQSDIEFEGQPQYKFDISHFGDDYKMVVTLDEDYDFPKEIRDTLIAMYLDNIITKCDRLGLSAKSKSAKQLLQDLNNNLVVDYDLVETELEDLEESLKKLISKELDYIQEIKELVNLNKQEK